MSAEATSNSSTDRRRPSSPTSIAQSPQGEFVVFGTVYAKPHLADRLEALYQQTTLDAASEPGTIYYCIARDEEQRHVFHFFERYAGREAFDAHNATETVKTILREKCFERVVHRFCRAIEGRNGGVEAAAAAAAAVAIPDGDGGGDGGERAREVDKSSER